MILTEQVWKAWDVGVTVGFTASGQGGPDVYKFRPSGIYFPINSTTGVS